MHIIIVTTTIDYFLVSITRISYSDHELLESIHGGETERYALLYERYKQKIYNYIWNFLHYDQEAATTITSDVFIKLFDYCQHKPITNFSALAYKTAHNLCINRIQKHKHETFIKNDEQREQFTDTYNEYTKEQLEQSYKAQALKECLTQLNTQQREIIYLYYHPTTMKKRYIYFITSTDDQGYTSNIP